MQNHAIPNKMVVFRTAHIPRLLALATLALCILLFLTAGRADAGPPKESDYEEFDFSEAQCKNELIRRDSFQGVFTGIVVGDFCHAVFTLPSGEETSLLCGEDEAEQWYGGKNRGKPVTVYYEVRQFWNEFGVVCSLTAMCAEPPTAQN